ncbi:hypothetical protein BJV78DRAFT_1203965 [Lactifluus subvellereus]|nr:hypothetical protein BJV78DRAFT_1203965 [Lactifluus subvellereus]
MASRTSSPSSDGMRGRCMLLRRLDGWLALTRLALAALLNDTIVARVGVREDAVEDVAHDGEPMPPLTSPTDSIVGMRLITPPSIAIVSSEGTSRPNSSMVV